MWKRCVRILFAHLNHFEQTKKTEFYQLKKSETFTRSAFNLRIHYIEFQEHVMYFRDDSHQLSM